MKVKILSKSGKKSSEMEVKEEEFSDKLNRDLISQVFRVELLAKKKLAHTKDRSERSGGGRKPWRQKGTGRARHGSIRSPLWRKGGVTFGPRNENNFKKKINRQMKRRAAGMLIANQHKNNKLIVLSGLPEIKKTKEMEKYILSLPIDKPGSILLALDKDRKDIARYCRNIPYITFCDRGGLNIYNILNHDYLITTKKLLEEFIKSISGKNQNKDK